MIPIYLLKTLFAEDIKTSSCEQLSLNEYIVESRYDVCNKYMIKGTQVYENQMNLCGDIEQIVVSLDYLP